MNKLDINKELENILVKNEIIKATSFDKVIEILHNLEKESINGKKIGLYGVGIEAERLIYFISQYTRKLKIDVCFDKTMRSYFFKKIVRDREVYPIENIAYKNVDYIILGSYSYRKEFVEKLKSIQYKGNIVDLYIFLKDYIQDHFSDYKILYQVRQSYLKADNMNKSRLLERLIKEYILSKDFINAFRNIDLYIESGYPAYKQYKSLKSDLQELLCKIQAHMNERKHRDIIINWVDALSFYDLPKFPFLKKKADEGICFENAYTVMPWTTETTKTILCGEYPIEGKLFLREELSKKARLLRILSEFDYKFGYCGMPKFAKLFDESVVISDGCYDNKYSGSLQKQWEALDMLCCNENPMCILIHTLRETHEPFICGNSNSFICFGSTKRDWEQELCRKQAEEAGDYINDQLAFYENFYSSNAVKIYMSDHGRVGNSPMDEKKIHIMLTITGVGMENIKVSNLFSLVNFPDLIEMLLRNEKEWDALTKEFVIIENLDAYNERIVQKTLSGELSKEEMYQCRGIVTLTDKYYQYKYGKEYYFIDRNSTDNEIANPDCRKRIMELKKLCGEEFIDIFQFDKFKYSRMLY